MAIKLHHNCKAQLEKRIVEILAHTTVSHRRLPNFPSSKELLELHKILPTQVQKELVGIVGDEPLFYITYSTIFRGLSEKFEYELNENAVLLSSLPGFENIEEMAHRCISILESLPHKYQLFVRLPLQTGCGLPAQWDITDNLALIEGDKTFTDKFGPLEDEPKSQLLDSIYAHITAGKTTKHHYFIRRSFRGFVPVLTRSSITLNEALADVRAFCGAAQVCDFIEFKQSPLMSKQVIKIHCFEDPAQSQAPIANEELRTGEAIKIFQMTLSQSVEKFATDPISLFSRSPEERFESWLIEKKRDLATLFANNEHASRLRRSCQWYFESCCGENDLLAFVQATTAIEILLGDSKRNDEIGTTELLKNRCSYLIGYSLKDRDKIAGQFNAIYEVRSRIVHNGKSHLSSTDRDHFYMLQKFCRRIIRRELGMILADG